MERRLDRILRLLYGIAVGLCRVIAKNWKMGFAHLNFGSSFGPGDRIDVRLRCEIDGLWDSNLSIFPYRLFERRNWGGCPWVSISSIKIIFLYDHEIYITSE